MTPAKLNIGILGVALALPVLNHCLGRTEPLPSSYEISIPRIWDERALADWATPLAGINLRPNHYSEADYYAAPIDNLRTYPVYHPDHEPGGYREWLKKQGARPLIEAEKLKTEGDWIEAGERIFDELDFPLVRTSDEKAIEYLQDREAIKKDNWRITRKGALAGIRWVVEKDGEVKLGLSDCSGCHTKVTDDGSEIRGAQGNLTGGGAAFEALVKGFEKSFSENGKAMPLLDLAYVFFAVPWIKDDIHLKFKTLGNEELRRVGGTDLPETFARFNASPYYTTKIPDLIGIKDRRYIDHTGTHQNRGPEDIARYAALVSYADDGSVGSYKLLNDRQRRLRYRFSDEALFALAKFLYSLEQPPNPNKFDEVAARGRIVFNRTGCAVCHTPPLYTNNMLIPVDGFEPPKNDPITKNLRIMEGVRIGTDPGLALRTRKGTGYYKVPSLKGLWHRRVIEHSGSIASLEEWFGRTRLSDNFVPGGWKGPGVEKRAVKGHEFGLDLSPEDRRALIAFLKTL